MKPSTSRRIPTLCTFDATPEDYARTTCFAAGHLVAKNAGWRNVRPVIDAATCTGCLQCYLYCPDGTVFKTHTQDGGCAVAIDYDFCKGCGICARMCAFGSISMVSEAEALEAEDRAVADVSNDAAAPSAEASEADKEPRRAASPERCSEAGKESLR